MEEWKEYKLGDIISIKSGFAYKGKDIGFGSNFLLGMGCVSFKEKFLDSGVRLYNGECSDKYCVKTGDIVLATRQQSDNLPILGMPAIIPNGYDGKKIIVGANLYKVENKSDFDNRYLFWLLKSPSYIDYIKSCQTGTTVRMITKSNIESYTFRAPNLNNRNKIVSILSSLDDKIEVNRRINEQLKELAGALFKSWFVDFEPFKDGEFVESELGMIPEGWKIVDLKEFCIEIVRGYTPKYAEFSDYPILNQKVNKGDKLEKQYYKYNKNDDSVPLNKMAQRGDVYLNSLGQGTLGRIHLYKDELSNVIVDQFITILRTDSFIKSAYLASILKSPIYQNEIESRITGSTGMWVLTINNIRNIKIVQPLNSLWQQLENIIEPIYRQIAINEKENEHLTNLRDTLLPKLMSGEIDVNEVEI